MKIIIHSMAELLELTALIRGGTTTTKVGEIEHTIKIDTSDFDPVKLAMEINDHCGTVRGEYEFEQACSRGLPTDIEPPSGRRQNELPNKTSVEELIGPPQTLHLDGSVTTDDLPGVDADGAHHDREWHSDPAKLTAKGLWRARRGRDEDAYKAWLLSLAVDIAEAAVAADAEPVATETHALPQDEQHSEAPALEGVAQREIPSSGVAEQSEAPTVDLQALVETCRSLAPGYSTDVREALDAAKDFSTKHGHTKFNELKSAVAPIDGNPFGKALQLLSPEERQLIRACFDNYPTHKED